LRFFHILEISPSGWISLPPKKTIQIKGSNKTTSCDYEFVINHKYIIPLNDKETSVPYKILSFDIEASSSHGDFPVPIKSYKKLATNIVDYFEKLDNITVEECKIILRKIIRAAFGREPMTNIDLVYPKQPINDDTELTFRTEHWLKTKVRDNKINNEEFMIELLFENANKIMQEKEKRKENDIENNENSDNTDSESGEDGEEEPNNWRIVNKYNKNYDNMESTIITIMCDKTFEREGKINELVRSLRNNFPALEGDKVTFIGSTYINYGEKEPHLNH
jgi:hypothetical protein